ncbi:ficolin-2-like [Uranotaenia lowii]|uniref:ficolin-2-like n=1 Tax=Uranotaenia lowii TaxID=190385 RepID=UPI00247A18E3|nr:ficolin-2-like [Uranotaenia lowii]
METKIALLTIVFCYYGSAIPLENSSAPALGYELTIAGLDSINFNMHSDYLRSKEHFDGLRAELEEIRDSIRSIEALAQRHSRTLAKLESEAELTTMSLTRLTNSNAAIHKLQQLQPSTEMLNDLLVRFLTNSSFEQTLGNIPQLSKKEAQTVKTCSDLTSRTSGIYRLQPDDSTSFEALCDQEYEGGGWTVIQNRFNGSVDFYRKWAEYEQGFGNLESEFWLGLEKIHRLTSFKTHELHVVLEAFDGKKAVAKYSHFLVDGADQKYALSKLGTYSGSAGDSLSYGLNMKFTTQDADHDTHGGNCAVDYKGAWWYKACHFSNLNGLYKKGSFNTNSMCWNAFKSSDESLHKSRMMIRAVRET